MEEKEIPQNIRDGLKARARKLRAESTEAEEFMWEILRNRQLRNLKFRRQHLIGAYIVDFYCAKHKLVIELDGPIHDKQKGYDQQREKDLSSQGFKILRFTNQDATQNIEKVLRIIREIAKD